jgi:hypothetical protein
VPDPILDPVEPDPVVVELFKFEPLLSVDPVLGVDAV